MGLVLGAGHPRLVAFLRGVGMPPDLAAEIVSDTLESLIRGLPWLRDPVAFESWFWSVARNRMRTGIRRYRSARTPADAEVSPSSPEEAVLLAEEHVHIRAALGTLALRDRQLLWLREVEGLEYEEIGSRLGAATGTVRVACHRARRRLKEAFAKIQSP